MAPLDQSIEALERDGLPADAAVASAAASDMLDRLNVVGATPQQRGRAIVALAEVLARFSLPDVQSKVYAALVDLVTEPTFLELEHRLRLEAAISAAYYSDLLGDLDNLERWSTLAIGLADGSMDLCDATMLVLAEHYGFTDRADEARALIELLTRDRAPDLTIAIGVATLRQALSDEVPNLRELIDAVEDTDDPGTRGEVSAVSQLCTVAGLDVDALRLLERLMDGSRDDQPWHDTAINEICVARIARPHDLEQARLHTRRALLATARHHSEPGSPRLRHQRRSADRGVVSSAFSLAVDLDVAAEAVTAAEALAAEGLVDVLARGGLERPPDPDLLLAHTESMFARAWSGSLREPQSLFPAGVDVNAAYFIPSNDPGPELTGYRVTVVGDEAEVRRFTLSARSRRVLSAGPAERLGMLSTDLSALREDLFPDVSLLVRCERLIIVPQACLWNVPWHLLPVGGEVLGARCELDIVPSMGLWHELSCPPSVTRAVLLRDKDAPGSTAESAALHGAGFEVLEVWSADEGIEALHEAQLLVICCEASVRNGVLHLELDGETIGSHWLTEAAVPPMVVATACDAASGIERSEPAALPSLLLGSGAQWVLAPTTKLHGHLVVDLLESFYDALGRGDRPSDALTQALSNERIPLPARLSPLLAVGRGW